MWGRIVSFHRYIADVALMPHADGLVHRFILRNSSDFKQLRQNWPQRMFRAELTHAPLREVGRRGLSLESMKA